MRRRRDGAPRAAANQFARLSDRYRRVRLGAPGSCSASRRSRAEGAGQTGCSSWPAPWPPALAALVMTRFVGSVPRMLTLTDASCWNLRRRDGAAINGNLLDSASLLSHRRHGRIAAAGRHAQSCGRRKRRAGPVLLARLRAKTPAVVTGLVLAALASDGRPHPLSSRCRQRPVVCWLECRRCGIVEDGPAGRLDGGRAAGGERNEAQGGEPLRARAHAAWLPSPRRLHEAHEVSIAWCFSFLIRMLDAFPSSAAARELLGEIRVVRLVVMGAVFLVIVFFVETA